MAKKPNRKPGAGKQKMSITTKFFLAGSVLHFVEEGYDAERRLVELLSEGRNAQFSGKVLKNLLTIMLLQFLDGKAYCRLGNIKLFRCLRNGIRLADCYKGFEVSYGHNIPPLIDMQET